MSKLFGMLGEGLVPPKGSKKYKAHMAAMHANSESPKAQTKAWKIKSKDIVAGMSTDANGMQQVYNKHRQIPR